MSSQTETNSGSKCTSSIHECDLVGEGINIRSLIYSHSLFHYMEASLHQLQQIGIYKLFAKGTDASFLSIYSHVTQCNAPPPFLPFISGLA